MKSKMVSLIQIKLCCRRFLKKKIIILSNQKNISEESTVSTKHSMSISGYHDKATVDILVEKLWEGKKTLAIEMKFWRVK